MQQQIILELYKTHDILYYQYFIQNLLKIKILLSMSWVPNFIKRMVADTIFVVNFNYFYLDFSPK